MEVRVALDVSMLLVLVAQTYLGATSNLCTLGVLVYSFNSAEAALHKDTSV